MLVLLLVSMMNVKLSLEESSMSIQVTCLSLVIWLERTGS